MLEKLNSYPVTTKTVDAFGGLDRRIDIPAGSFSDMNNLTCDDLPAVSTRKKRAFVKDKIFLSASAMNEVNGDIYFFAESKARDDGSISLYKNTTEITTRSFDSQKKRTAVMGADIIIFPDKVKYNTLSGEFESLVKKFSSNVEINVCDSLYKEFGAGSEIKSCICLSEEEMSNVSVSGKSGEKAVADALNSHDFDAASIILYCPTTSVFKTATLTDGGYSADECTVLDYNGTNDMYLYDIRDEEIYIGKKDSAGEITYGKDIPYLRITGAQISSLFSQWDNVSVSFSGGATANMCLNGEKVISKADTDRDCIYIRGAIDHTYENVEADNITIVREIPDMDHICAYENRLYGCRFKKAEGQVSSSLNEIYVSKLGEPDNFSFSDSETGAYAVSVGENGEFTAVCGYNGYVCFFKERCVILMDRYFSISVIHLDGVNIHGATSVAQTGGKLIYTGTNGVYVFNGSNAVKISDKLGEFDMLPICACAHDGKYYLNSISRSEYSAARTSESVKTAAQAAAAKEATEKLEMAGIKSGTLLYRVYLNLYKTLIYPFCLISASLATIQNSQMYVYDTVKNVWSKENVGNVASCMTADAQNVYYIDSKGTLNAYDGSFTKDGIEFETEREFGWYCVSTDLGRFMNSKKYISRIGIRIKPEKGTVVNIETEYDSSGNFTRMFTLRSVSDCAVTLPVIPVRSDHIRIKLSGTGACCLLGAFADFEEGSEIL